VEQDDDASHRVAMYALPVHLGAEAAAWPVSRLRDGW
jgi:hypothetical protein